MTLTISLADDQPETGDNSSSAELVRLRAAWDEGLQGDDFAPLNFDLLTKEARHKRTSQTG